MEEVKCSRCGEVIDINDSYENINDPNDYICEECFQDYLNSILTPEFEEED